MMLHNTMIIEVAVSEVIMIKPTFNKPFGQERFPKLIQSPRFEIKSNGESNNINNNKQIMIFINKLRKF